MKLTIIGSRWSESDRGDILLFQQNSLDLDFDRPQERGLDDNFRPNVDGQYNIVMFVIVMLNSSANQNIYCM